MKNIGVWADTSCGIQFVTPTTMHWPLALKYRVSEPVEFEMDEETQDTGKPPNFPYGKGRCWPR